MKIISRLTTPVEIFFKDNHYGNRVEKVYIRPEINKTVQKDSVQIGMEKHLKNGQMFYNSKGEIDVKPKPLEMATVKPIENFDFIYSGVINKF